MSQTQKYNVRGKLTVTAVQARNVAVKQLIGEMDPFAVFKIKGEKFKTPVSENGHRNPKWNFSFIANLDGDEDGVHIKLNNKGNVSDDLIARCDILLPDADLSGRPAWYSLRDPDQFTKECGEIELTFVFEGTGLPVGSKALATHETRTRGGPAAVAPLMSPVGQPQYGSQQSPQYASPPPQQQVYGQPPPQQPVYGQPPQQPQYASIPPQQQQPQYATIPQQQPQYAPIPPQQQQPQYAPIPQQQPQYAPIPQQVVYQAPPAQVVYQQPPQQVIYQQPAPVMVVQQQPQTSMMGGLAMGIGNMMGQAAQFGAQMVASVSSGHWDSLGYHNQHPDVKAAGMDAWVHYSTYGHNEGRIIVLTNGARGKWNDAGYLQLHPDVAKAGMNGFNHFKQYGKNENRQIMVTPVTGPTMVAGPKKGKWDSAGYLRVHPDVAKARMDAWVHYKTYGHNERRTIVLTNGQQGKWDANGYFQSHPDVKAAGMDAWNHFNLYGKNENRDITVV